MELKTWLVLALPVAGTAFGVVLQQVIDVWKTGKLHRHELQRRFFDVKFEAALSLAKSLDAVMCALKAQFAEAVEWTREDEQFMWLDVSRNVLNLHRDALAKNYEQYVSAYAVMDIVFPSTLVDSAVWRTIGTDLNLLNQAWRIFDERRFLLERQLNVLMPDGRREELRTQRSTGHFDDAAQREMEHWIATYKTGTSELRAELPRLAQLTDAADQRARAAVRALREELKPYTV